MTLPSAPLALPSPSRVAHDHALPRTSTAMQWPAPHWMSRTLESRCPTHSVSSLQPAATPPWLCLLRISIRPPIVPKRMEPAPSTANADTSREAGSCRSEEVVEVAEEVVEEEAVAEMLPSGKIAAKTPPPTAMEDGHG
jgi:hypothetical protein